MANRSTDQPQWIAAGDNQRRRQAFDCSQHRRIRLSRPALHQEHGRQQSSFACPESGKLSGRLRRIVRSPITATRNGEILKRKNLQLSSQLMRNEGRHIFLSATVVAAEMHHWRFLRLKVGERNNLCRHPRVFIGNPVGIGTPPHQRLQAGVEAIHSCERMQDALVDAERGSGKSEAGFHLDQARAPQRSRRRKRAPVRIVQRSKGKAKSDASPPFSAEQFTNLCSQG